VKNSASQQTTNGSHNGAHCQAVHPTTPKSTPFGRDGQVMHGMWSIGMTNVVNLSRTVVWDRVHVLLVTYILPLWQNTVTLYAWAHAHQLWLGVPKDPSLGHYSSLFTLLHCPPLPNPFRSFSSSTQIRNSMSLCHPYIIAMKSTHSSHA